MALKVLPLGVLGSQPLEAQKSPGVWQFSMLQSVHTYGTCKACVRVRPLGGKRLSGISLCIKSSVGLVELILLTEAQGFRPEKNPRKQRM